MIVSHIWLAEHINDPDIVILDSRGSVAVLGNKDFFSKKKRN
jgi:hypothetical protein